MSPSEADRELAEAAQHLYAVPPPDFTAERDRLAREARGAGHRERAGVLAAMRRPTVAAWAVNLLVREEAELVGQVLEIGDSLRKAQAGSAGDALRELGRRRRELIMSVVARARALVVAHGGSLNAQAEQHVAETLQAALADAEAAGAVLSGLLIRPLASTGLGSVDLRGHVAPTATDGSEGPPPRAPRGRPTANGPDVEAQQAELRAQAAERRRLVTEAAQARIAEAEQAVAEAEEAQQGVRVQIDDAGAQVLHLEARIDELRRQLAQVEAEAESASQRLEDLQGEAQEAEADLESARAELGEAEADLGKLQ